MKKAFKLGSVMLGAALAFTAVPVAGATTAVTERRECIFETNETENDFADRINALRQKRERTGLNLDQVLTAGATVVSEVIAREDALLGSRARAQTREHVIADTLAAGGLIMKGKTIDAIWKRASKNQFPRSVIMRKHFRHQGVAITEANDRVYMVVLFGSELLTPIGC